MRVLGVSRTHPGLIKRLFELEVPEIVEGVVEIRGRPGLKPFERPLQEAAFVGFEPVVDRLDGAVEILR